MKKSCLLFFITLGLAAAASPLTNPALNPVTVEKAPEHAPLVLVDGGKARFAIVGDTAAEAKLHDRRRSVTRAVEVLREAFKQCAGVDVEILSPGDPNLRNFPVLIVVGNNIDARQLGLDGNKMPREGFTIRTSPKMIAIVGHDEVKFDKQDWERTRANGTLHGALDFVERFLGVRYYFPGIGTIWPKCEKLVIEPMSYRDAPEFATRHTHCIPMAMKEAAAIPGLASSDNAGIWEDRYRMGRTRYWAGHAPPPHNLAKKFPDKMNFIFYRDPSGHLYYTDKQHIGNYLDVSNLKLADLLLDELEKHYKTGARDVWEDHNANSQYVTFGQCDTFVSAMVNDTIRKLKLIPPNRAGSREGELSDVYARFTFYLADQMKKRFPGKRLSLIPYHNYVLPPVKPEYRKFPDNVDLRVCIYEYPCKTPSAEVNKKWRAAMKEYYHMLGNRPVASLWLYNEARNMFVRAVAGRYVADIPKELGPYLGREELFFDYHIGGHDWPYYYTWYVVWRSMWNSKFNIDAALDEQWKLLYGNAAPHVKAFYDLLRERHEKFGAQGADRKVTYNKIVLDKLDDLLKKAQAAVPAGSVEAQRLALFATPWPKAIKEARGVLSFERPQVKIVKLEPTDKITLDGKADEALWKRARVMKTFDARGSGEPGKNSSEGRLAWDEKGLYGFYTFGGRPMADGKKSLWANCNMEFFLSPGVKADEYFQYAFDPLNRIHAGQKTLKPVDTPYDDHWPRKGSASVASIGEDSWSVEFFIPWAELKGMTPEDYDTWLGNVVVNRVAPKADYTSFSMTLGNNHTVEQFGFFKFLGKGD